MTHDANNQRFEFRFRVRYSECDAQGVVFNARYADYVDLAITEYWRCIVGGYKALVARGLETQVVSLLINWKSPARFDDVICARVHSLKLGNTSLTIGVEFSVLGGSTVASSEITYVMVDVADFSKTPIPDDLRDKLLQGAPGVIVDQSGIDN